MVAHQVHKNGGAHIFTYHAPLFFAQAHKPLRARTRPHRNKQNAAFIKLIRQGTRHFRPTCRNNNPVKRCSLRHPEGAVTPLHVNAAKPQLPPPST